MSIGRISAHNSSPAFERRLRVRQRLSDLAYLEIGADNGGIVLNLTDEGMSFQAVAPLGDHREINLRIQLPRSRTLIETTAEIIWLGPENRQAGVRFLNMREEARVQIQQWINSLLSPVAPREEPDSTEASGDAVQRQEPPRPARRDKWLTLMAECQDQKQHIENPPPIQTNPEPAHADPISQEDPLPFETQHNASADSAPPDVPNHAELSDETPPYRPASKLDNRIYRFQLNVQPKEEAPFEAGAATGYHKPSGGDFIDWPIRTPQIVPPTLRAGARESPLPSIESNGLPVSSAIPKPNLPAGKSGTLPIPLMPAANTSARRWVAVVILFVGISFLCFGIGRWIRHRGSHPEAAHPPAEPAVTVPVAQPAPEPGNHTSDGTRLTVNQRRPRPEDTRTRYVPERRQPEIALSANSPRLESHSETTPAKENAPPSAAGKPPEIKATPTPVPVIAESADPPLVGPRIIAGRKLRPTDRYNSCHLSYRVEPEYPLAAKLQQIEGAVKIHQVIKADGSVQSVKLLSGPPLLAPAAMEAAKYWRYFPALLNGQPVEAELDVEIDFRLPR